MKNHDLINRYFENSLSPEEQKLFNNLLQNDATFKEEFLFQKDLKQVIAVSQQEELKSTLSHIEENVQKNSRFMIVPKKWMVAASLLLITTLGMWTVKSLYYPSNDEIYETYFEVDRNTIQPVVRGESLNTIEYRAFVAYEAQDYYKAINLFNSVKNPDEIYIIYYKGLCFLALEKTDEAIALLSNVANTTTIDGKSADLEEKANWYLALAYLKNNDTENAISRLSLINNDPSSIFKKQEAQEVLNYLK
jgi:tetratricopeptide (TPR) repeat protein